MGAKKRLATVSVDHGRLVLLTFDAVTADGVVTPKEQRSLRQRLEAWHKASIAADASQALGHAMERGIGDREYLGRLVDAYQTAVDEVEPLTAA